MIIVIHYQNLIAFSHSERSDIRTLRLLRLPPYKGIVFETLIVSKPINSFPSWITMFHYTIYNKIHWILTLDKSIWSTPSYHMFLTCIMYNIIITCLTGYPR
jgi:hypothetical protein